MRAPQICPGSCNTRWRKEHAIYEDAITRHAAEVQRLTDAGQTDEIPAPPKPPNSEPWWGEPVWCGKCKSIIRTELAELDELAAHLAALPPGIRPAADRPAEDIRVSGSKVTRSPSPSGDDLDEVAAWLRDWETYYRDQRQWPAVPQRGYLAGRITSGVNWLTEHLDGLMLTDEAEAFGTEVRRWHRELVAKTHSARSAKHVKKPCPRCRQYSLWEEVGKTYVVCKNSDCNRVMTREELDTPAGL